MDVDICHRTASLPHVVHRELDLHFPSQHFVNVNISETMKASAKMRETDSYRVYYLSSNHYTANVPLRDLDLNLQGKN